MAFIAGFTAALPSAASPSLITGVRALWRGCAPKTGCGSVSPTTTATPTSSSSGPPAPRPCAGRRGRWRVPTTGCRGAALLHHQRRVPRRSGGPVHGSPGDATNPWNRWQPPWPPAIPSSSSGRHPQPGRGTAARSRVASIIWPGAGRRWSSFQSGSKISAGDAQGRPHPGAALCTLTFGQPLRLDADEAKDAFRPLPRRPPSPRPLPTESDAAMTACSP